MPLATEVRDPARILGTGLHAGHRWVVIAARSATRSGYVEVGPGHPWHGKGVGEVDAEVHGCVTFGDCGLTEAGELDSMWWIGFDTNHDLDHPDPALMTAAQRDNRDMRGGHDPRGRVADQWYVERECVRLCEQAAEVAAVRPTEVAPA